MCGRYYLKIVNLELLTDYGVVEAEGFNFHGPRYNIGPMTPIPIVRTLPGMVGLELTSLNWGLVPLWAGDPKYGSRCINVRADGIDKKPAFKGPLRKRRCVIPADGFFEWRAMDAKTMKQPYAISFKSGAPLLFAGLWERNSRTGVTLETTTIITTEANSLVERAHDRMPVILSPEAVDVWLNPTIEDPRRLLPLLAPYKSDALKAVPVSTFVSKVGNEGPACTEPLADPEEDLAL